MDIVTIIMFITGIGMVLGAFIIEGGDPSTLLAPTAMMIIFGGTIGAVGVSFPGDVLKKFPKVFMKAFSKQNMDRAQILETFMALSTTARRDGLLALEHELEVRELDDLTKTGLRLVIDGADEEVLRQILETRILNMVHRHEKGIAMFEAAGGFSPTMGVIGTVLGMINVLGKMAESSDLGADIAVAFIATFFGVGVANLVWLPIAGKLKELNSEEVLSSNMIIEAIQLLRTGSNPAFMKEQLKGYLEHEDEGKAEEGER